MAHVPMIKHFLLEQGCKAAETISILEDNQSAILLEQNAILSCSKSTKHSHFEMKNLRVIEKVF